VFIVHDTTSELESCDLEILLFTGPNNTDTDLSNPNLKFQTKQPKFKSTLKPKFKLKFSQIQKQKNHLPMCGDMWPLVMVTDDGRLDGTGWKLVVAQPRAEGSTSGAASRGGVSDGGPATLSWGGMAWGGLSGELVQQRPVAVSRCGEWRRWSQNFESLASLGSIPRPAMEIDLALGIPGAPPGLPRGQGRAARTSHVESTPGWAR
jgi:hypothetical protein